MTEAEAPDSRPAASARDYRETLFLPETDFPMKAGLPQREPERLAEWAAMDLYRQLRADGRDRPKFVYHDGPPYANGAIHVGHAENKILKDFVIRSRQMAGYDADYIPGWDCHGLPIEWKVEEAFRSMGRRKEDVSPVEFRAACRAYAERWIPVQKAGFQRLGIEGDWENYYSTMAFAAEAAIAGEFLKVVGRGLVYRGSKPVMWSAVERTSLAEAEVEYQEKTSQTIWVKFPVDPRAAPGEWPDLSVVIWTTTPWTIPGNRAIAFGPEISYGVYEAGALVEGLEFAPWARTGEVLAIADALAESVFAAAKVASFRRLGDFVPEGLICRHPLAGLQGGYEFPVPLLAGGHVTDDSGTGFVHTAPGHGAEDYQLWLAHGKSQADIPFTVDVDGRLTDEAPGFSGLAIITLEGKNQGKDGPANKAVIEQLIARNALLARGLLKHQYPHSWRSKAPLIFRNTAQWFIALDRPYSIEGEDPADARTLRARALSEIARVDWGSDSAQNRIRTMVAERPDWLISRQRAWGVPLAIFVHRTSGEILRDPAVDARILAAMEKAGADAWFAEPAASFLGEAHDPAEWEKVEDILDVWFDSGSSYAFVLDQPRPEGRPALPFPADLYLEGSDQHRGWFQSSLLHGCATRGHAPFRAVRTHGFVVDEQGRKMSKALGNGVEPEEIIRQYGAEILRTAIAAADWGDDLRLGKTILDQAAESYRKLRNSLRFLLGALKGFDPRGDEVAPLDADTPMLEQWLYHRLATIGTEIRAGYETCEFRHALSAVLGFCVNDLSAFYFDVRKDSLYCDRPDSPKRRACRTALNVVFERLTLWLAPILPFTTEEASRFRNPDARSVHLQQFPGPITVSDIAHAAAAIEEARKVRTAVTGALEIARREKRIGASLEAHARIIVRDAELAGRLAALDFAELCITSAASIEHGDPDAGEDAGSGKWFALPDLPGVAVTIEAASGRKCARSWKYSGDVGKDGRYPDLSPRDAEAVALWDEKHG